MSVMSVTEVRRLVQPSVRMNFLRSAKTATAGDVIEAHHQMVVWTLGMLSNNLQEMNLVANKQ